MLSRILSLGHRAVALAGYDFDFFAVRQRSERGGSLYSFKKKSELESDIEDDIKCKKFLSTYFGHIFGQVEDVRELARIHYSFGSCKVLSLFQPDESCSIRLKCPLGAPCRLVELWDMQIEVLQQIMAKDQLEFGGVIVDSFLEFEGAPAQSDDVSPSILVRARAMNGLSKELDTDYCIIGKISISRYQAKESNPEFLEMLSVNLFIRDTGLSTAISVVSLSFSTCPSDADQIMLAKLKANRVSSLAKTVYNRDFFAVRDRTDGDEDVYNFKAARAQRSRESPTLILLSKANETYYIRLACPKDATCDGTNVFRMQLRTLKIILEVDEMDLIVLRPKSHEERTAMEHEYCVPEAIGRMLECKLVLERRLRYRRGEAMVKRLGFATLTRLRESAWATRATFTWVPFVESVQSGSDLIIGGGCYRGLYYAGPIHFRQLPSISVLPIVSRSPSVSLSPSVLRHTKFPHGQHLKQAGELALAAVEYGVDFAAMRQMSGANGEDFLFVELTPSASSTTFRNRIRGFKNGSCEGKRIYRRQLQQLRQILDVDGGTEDNVAESWLDMSSCCREWSRRDDCFYVMLKNPGPGRTARFKAIGPGNGLAFCCAMTRIDTTVSRSKYRTTTCGHWIANLARWRGPYRVKRLVVNFVLLSRS
ncbi:hypothetical protein C8F04DRAFT_1199710 [Mycena alexandri]|uniref:Uncharacterized protein n=1 Tax=Mycena alexandri TaxID=1745969 RepID=A0AAD6WMF9_9AGAR|nr:hypothetical protein C8F04DRAFT_1199710 [Mycena alexandri]